MNIAIMFAKTRLVKLVFDKDFLYFVTKIC